MDTGTDSAALGVRDKDSPAVYTLRQSGTREVGQHCSGEGSSFVVASFRSAQQIRHLLHGTVDRCSHYRGKSRPVHNQAGGLQGTLDALLTRKGFFKTTSEINTGSFQEVSVTKPRTAAVQTPMHTHWLDSGQLPQALGHSLIPQKSMTVTWLWSANPAVPPCTSDNLH